MPKLKVLKVDDGGQFNLDDIIVDLIPIGCPVVLTFPSRFGPWDWYFEEYFAKPLEKRKPSEATCYCISEDVGGGGAFFHQAVQYYKLKE